MLDTQLIRVLSEPLAIEERAGAAIERFALRELGGEKGDCTATRAALKIDGITEAMAAGVVVAESGGSKKDGSDFGVAGSVAVVHVWGVLDRKDPMSKGSRVGTGYERVARTLAAARADDRVGSILLLMDSPGGAVRGINEGGDAAFDAAESGRAGGLPVIAFAPDLMASAALWLGVQADKVFAGPGAWVGSLGVRLSTVDYSALLEREGIKVHTIKSGEFKDLGNPYRALTERDRGKLQEEVDAHFRQFKGAVAKGRRLAADRVDAIATGEGFIGQAAVVAGLVDAVKPSVAAVLAEMNRQYPVRGRKASAGGPLTHTDARSASMTPEEAAKHAADQKAAAELKQKQDEAVKEAAKAVGEAAATAATAALARERERVTAIEAKCKPFEHVAGVAELRTKALTTEAAMTPEQVGDKVLALVTAAATPLGAMDVNVGSSGWDREREGLASVLVARLDGKLVDTMERGGDPANRVAKAMGFDDAQTFLKRFKAAEAGGLRRLRLMDIAERCAKLANPSRFGRGVFGGGYDNEVLGTAFGHSSSDFPHLLSNVANKTLMGYFAEITPKYPRFCAIGESKDFKSEDLVTLSELPNLLLAPEGSALKEATINERKEAIRLATYGRKFSITREAVTNDDLSGIQRTLQTWGIVAGRTPDILAFTILTANPTMADGVALFHANHGNLGTPAALSIASMSATVKLMKRQRGFGEDRAYIEVTPKTLLTGTALWDTAIKVTTSVIDPTAANANNAVPNVIQRLGIDPIDSPYLDTSDTQWFVAGDPRITPGIEVRFLNGNRNPIVTLVGNGSIRGQEMEVLFDVAAKAVQWEALQKNAGA